MLMIRPQPRPAIAGPKRWPSRKGAVRLTAMSRSQSAAVSAASGGRTLRPAAFTTMSGSPNGPVAASAARSRPAGSARSALTQADWPPSARSHAAVSASAASPRASTTTCAPARPSAPAMARPIPELPPVTSATRPSSENSPSRNPVMATILMITDTFRLYAHEIVRDHGKQGVGSAGLGPALELECGAGANEAERARRQPAAAGQGLHRRLLVQPRREEPGAERVAGARAVHEPLQWHRGDPDRFPPVGEHGTVGAEFHSHLRIPGGQHPDRLHGVVPP